MTSNRIISGIYKIIDKKHKQYSHPLLVKHLAQKYSNQHDDFTDSDLEKMIGKFFKSDEKEIEELIKFLEAEEIKETEIPGENIKEAICRSFIKIDDELIHDVPMTRRRSFIVPDATCKLVVYEKSKEMVDFLSEAMRSTLINDLLNPRQFRILVSVLKPLQIKKNDVLIREHEIGDKMYLIESGSLVVYKNSKAIYEAVAGEVVGQVAIIHNMPRTATVIAKTDCNLWYCTQIEYYTLKTHDQKTKYYIFSGYMKKEFANLGFRSYEEAARASKFVFLSKDDVLKTNYYLVTVAAAEVIVENEKKKVKAGELLKEGAIVVDELEGYYVRMNN